MITLQPAETPHHVELARELLWEYVSLPHVAGRWIDIEAEIAGMPGAYAPPGGVILLAMDGKDPVGCGCLRPFDEPGVCEMKRLFVRPAARRRGVGEMLVRSLVHHALGLRYITMKLDTAPELSAARALYRRLGFREIPHYRSGLPNDSVCYELHLTA